MAARMYELRFIGFALTLALTIGCSSDDGDGDSGGISSLPTQLYIKEVIKAGTDCDEYECIGPIYGNTYAHSGNGDILFSLYDNEDNRNIFSAGRIQNGKVVLDLPEIPDKYLKDEGVVEPSRRFFVMIPGMGNNSSCGLYLRSSEENEGGILIYSSKTQKEQNLNISKGWNVYYFSGNNISQDSKTIKGELQWQAHCNIGNDVDYSGFPQSWTSCQAGDFCMELLAANCEIMGGQAVAACGNPRDVVYGSLTDSRDGQTYKTVKIVSQTWMAKNLNYNTSGSKCYGEGGLIVDNWNVPFFGTPTIVYGEPLSPGEIQANCQKYGRLYNWETALTACPSGWHLPDSMDWVKLVIATDKTGKGADKLKAQNGWFDRDGNPKNGTDDFGFSAMPGGMFGINQIDSSYSFMDAGKVGTWWMNNQLDNNPDICGGNMCGVSTVITNYTGSIFGGSFTANEEYVLMLAYNKSYLSSVRCIKD